jgi:hypothetical protein
MVSTVLFWLIVARSLHAVVAAAERPALLWLGVWIGLPAMIVFINYRWQFFVLQRTTATGLPVPISEKESLIGALLIGFGSAWVITKFIIWISNVIPLTTVRTQLGQSQ